MPVQLISIQIGKEVFFCPCHGSKFDLLGRVYAGVPAPTNMEVPPHYFAKDNILIIGSDGVA
jgi:ubiquinol-cytochrome c reductase iron-sulfur subunit